MSYHPRHSKSDRHGHSQKQHATKNSASSRSSVPYQCRFLFSVTELSYSYNYTPYYDHLNNQLPPRSPLEFGPKAPGKVFRYNNGDISEATGFFPGVPYYSPDDESWRPSTIGYYTDRVLGADGEVVRLAERTWIPQECYSTVTMYNCGPFAPCLFKHGDASNSEDPLSSSFGDFRMMHFILEGGVSRASTNGGLRKVAGNSPTWIGSLVPETYNDRKTGQVSTGLGGELPLVIGLMALAQDVGRCDRAFTEPKWTRNRWVGRRNPTGWPVDNEEPRGVVVEIAFDRGDGDGTIPPGGSLQDLQDFEWHGIAVKEL